MSAREPDPFAECRPGGSCPCCNPEPLWCQGCLMVEVEAKDDMCSTCEEAASEEIEADRALNEEREATT